MRTAEGYPKLKAKVLEFRIRVSNVWTSAVDCRTASIQDRLPHATSFPLPTIWGKKQGRPMHWRWAIEYPAVLE